MPVAVECHKNHSINPSPSVTVYTRHNLSKLSIIFFSCYGGGGLPALSPHARWWMRHTLGHMQMQKGSETLGTFFFAWINSLSCSYVSSPTPIVLIPHTCKEPLSSLSLSVCRSVVTAAAVVVVFVIFCPRARDCIQFLMRQRPRTRKRTKLTACCYPRALLNCKAMSKDYIPSAAPVTQQWVCVSLSHRAL